MGWRIFGGCCRGGFGTIPSAFESRQLRKKIRRKTLFSLRLWFVKTFRAQLKGYSRCTIPPFNVLLDLVNDESRH